jgi:hypothetical protein
MIEMSFAVAIAAAVLMLVPLLVGTSRASSQNIKMLEASTFRSDGTATAPRQRDSDLSIGIGIGSGGVSFGPRSTFRMVSTNVEPADRRPDHTQTTSLQSEPADQTGWIKPSSAEAHTS